ncbi:MAG: dethiobiotin synthase, partial [Rhodospirillaceae bacterium]|nr:dethiobiotin synthase [Rhodospirillaceae bacterium]
SDTLDTSDSGILLSALGQPIDAGQVAAVSPWRFREPLSPDMAAEREGRTIPFDELVAFCREDAGEDVTLIEGIGGVMVPLDPLHTVLDWIAALQAPALLVTGSYLGTLSHTLTAAGMLRARNVKLAGIVVNESEAQPVAPEETADVISRFAADVPVQVVGRLDAPESAPNLLPLLDPYLPHSRRTAP